MLIRTLCCALALSVTSAQALQIGQLPEQRLRELSATLADTAGSSHWQQLWKRSRDAGYFRTDGTQTRFTLPMTSIPDKVRETLGQAGSITPEQSTLALYRRDFAPQVTGMEGAQNLTAICLRVDWRSVPDNPQPEQLFGASLLLTYPCR
jgi:hypothetical protein